MIISRTPLRISFVGGGSDISGYYTKSNGAVVTTAINKYVYIMVEKQFDGRIIVQYSKTEIVKRIDDIKNNLVREAMKTVGINGGIHIISISDVPSEGTGLGSSSAYVVGLLNALYAFKGRHVGADQLAKEACDIEINKLGKPIGKQDQYIAAYGGFQFMRFFSDHSVAVDPIVCTPRTREMLGKKLLLFYTGLTRSADPILAKQNENLIQHPQRFHDMSRMVKLASEMYALLNSNRIRTFGNLLEENWMLKKNMAARITTSEIDHWYKIAKNNGATGGKILGAGGGGFLLLYADAKYHHQIKLALPSLCPLDFEFESQGSKIIFMDNKK